MVVRKSEKTDKWSVSLKRLGTAALIDGWMKGQMH